MRYIKKSSMSGCDYCSEDDEVVEVVRGGVQPWVRLEYMEDLQQQQQQQQHPSTETAETELAQGRTR